MLITTHTATLQGLQALPIEVEVDSTRGKPTFLVIGLAAKAVEEARERITNALGSCGVRLKAKRTVVNLAPADVKKTGSQLELAMAVALWEMTMGKSLVDAGDIFFGELALDGGIRPIRGALPLVTYAKNAGYKRIFVPAANGGEVSVIDGVQIFAVEHLGQVLEFYEGKLKLSALLPGGFCPTLATPKTDFSHIIGQNVAKRCLEIAAAGAHNLLLCGVPGAGKSLLAASVPGILPPLTREEALEITTIYSVCGLAGQGLITTRPCRAPHHTISSIGLAGGGANLRPGEISLSHHGVLFLDELGEFRRDALEILRQPLETGQITIARASGSVVYPARVTLIAATNPCPCGFLGSKKRACRCSQVEIERYRRKLSGPVLDRLDMQIFVPEVEVRDLTAARPPEAAETSADVRSRVCRARARQAERYRPLGLATTSELSSHQVREVVAMTSQARDLLARAVERFQLSARSYFKIIKVARTIADLAEEAVDEVTAEHIAEALGYRQNVSES